MELAVLIINGSPIGLGHINFDLTEEEKNVILNLNYLENKTIGRPLFISENSSIFKNEKLKRTSELNQQTTQRKSLQVKKN